MLLNQAKNVLVSRAQILLPKQMFPSLTILEETMFPSIARPHLERAATNSRNL